ncbi:MAG: hypothetical protein LBJ84_03710, partial [Oscillospiraceae bacterium]|nr:hypothetical protein [Oscillospiraceae bacterium]
MKFTRKYIVGIFAAMLSLALLASCSKDNNPAGTPAPSPSDTAPAAETPAQTPENEPEFGPDGRAFVGGALTERFTLKLVKPTQFNEAIFADYEGFFDEVGIDVEYIDALGQGVSLAQAVQTGIVDVFGSGHTNNIVLAR